MKKLLLSLGLIAVSFFSTKVQALTFSEAFEDIYNTPMVVLIYANWIDNYNEHLQQFEQLEKTYRRYFNFVTLNIADEDAKNFNQKYIIEKNLPYAMLIRDGGKITRYLNSSCILDESCMTSRLKSFIQ